MAHSAEPSSSLSFTSSSHLSNGSVNHNMCSSNGSDPGLNLEVVSLSKLSSNLEQLLIESDCDYSDADIIVEEIPVGVHRCILASRSKFFNELFKKGKGSSEKKDGKSKYCMSDLLPYGKVGLEAFHIFLGYIYTGKLKPSPTEVSTCVDNVCAHDACRPAINFAVELMYASSIFQIPELVSLFQRRLLNFVGKALVEDVIPILMVAFHCQLSQLVTQCVDRVARSDLDQISIEKELPFELSGKVKLLRNPPKDVENENDAPVVDALCLKRITRIHKALDSDDVELVKLLLNESDITLDEANAIHYAAAYCDPKVVSEVLSLGLADVNLRNSRGYTVLHIAAMRKEPSIIVSLLTKRACASDLTFDGQSAVSICRRLTRPKDYHAITDQGKETNKDRICIDVLEREMRRNPMAGDASMSSHTMADDLHMKLLYLENRVAFARLFFPSEAKLAMDIAHAETTSEFAGISASKGPNGNFREVDLNETPIMQNKRLLSRMEALMKTVEMGQRYFPHCSEVLDKFMEDDLPDLFYLEKGTREEQGIKRKRFVELKDDVCKAFTKDKAEFSLVWQCIILKCIIRLSCLANHQTISKLAKLGNACLAAVQAYDAATENIEKLNAAELKFQDIINSPSLDATCRKIDNLAKKKELDSTLVLMITKAYSAAKESNMMKDEVKDILYHLYKTAVGNLQRLVPKEIRIIKYLIRIEDPEEQLCALQDAFTPGEELEGKDVDNLYTTPEKLHTWIQTVVNAYHLSSEGSLIREARDLLNPEVIQKLEVLKKVVERKFM